MIDLKIKQFVAFITLLGFISCAKDGTKLSKIQGQQIPITKTHGQVDSITGFVSPYKNRIDKVLDSILAYAPKDLLLDDGKLTTTMGVLMADLIFVETEPLFKSQTGKTLDFAVLNEGGTRSIISKGNVSARTAFQVMPFENYIAVVEMDGKAVREMVSFLIRSERAHPFSGMQIVLDKNGGLESLNIQGKPFDENRNYFVATSDYLVKGGTSVGFFPNIVSKTDTGYLLRNAIIDHFKKVDTLSAAIDNRFIQRK